MATTKFKGQPVKVIGEFIKVGSVAPDFELVKTDLSSFSLKELNGKNAPSSRVVWHGSPMRNLQPP